MGSSQAGLFAGLCALDVLQAVERAPGVNDKVTTLDQAVAAGGPAANAAVTFAYLGGDATLVTGVGWHPLAAGIRADLDRAGVGPPSLVRGARAVLVDGHHPALAVAAAREARSHGVLCVLAGGSWKANTAELRPCIDVAVCSADFLAPGTAASWSTFWARATCSTGRSCTRSRRAAAS